MPQAWMTTMATNQYLDPEYSNPIGRLEDDTLLYPAFYPLRRNERHRRSMNTWNGAVGSWAGVTLEGQLYRQRRSWPNQAPDPKRWERFTTH